ncbi:hypothetical protein [Variovorax sp. RA8]|uniref:hypothetical protein n=1 Tax=Variovorax sp. (strain JCM 16519 / RA8) TaxID=662548 RepID=UPI000A6A3A53|nr:hypothetical protein [Variovorax sp. RA8]VTU44345.1 hypothetical protein RA8P2_00133 [Variovorax sp. RA8]
MSFKTTLFKALAAADSTVCNGQRVTSKMLDNGPEVLLRPYVDLANGATQYIQDQEMLVDDTGRAYTHAMDGEGEPIVWSFQVVRPMRAADVHTIDAPPLKVEEVVDRLMKIEREGSAAGPDFTNIQSWVRGKCHAA